MTPSMNILTGIFLLMILAGAISSLRLSVLRRRLNDNLQVMRDQQQALADSQKAQLAAINEVLDYFAGGITKRISESEEIASSLKYNAPDGFQLTPPVLYSLYANDQFMLELYRAAGHPADSSHKAFCQEQKRLRYESFLALFEKANLSPPPMP